jgi:hypothetical protein
MPILGINGIYHVNPNVRRQKPERAGGEARKRQLPLFENSRNAEMSCSYRYSIGVAIRFSLRLFGDDFTVLPDVDRRTVHARGLACDLGGPAQGTANGGGEFFCFLLHLT